MIDGVRGSGDASRWKKTDCCMDKAAGPVTQEDLPARGANRGENASSEHVASASAEAGPGRDGTLMERHAGDEEEDFLAKLEGNSDQERRTSNPRVGNERPRTAIIVVHGVADQELGDSVRAVAKCVSQHCVLGRPLVETQEIVRSNEPFATVKIATSDFARCRSLSLYELHWADLSRPQKSLPGVLSVLLSVLGGLPRHALQELDRAQHALESVRRETASESVVYASFRLAHLLVFGLALPCMYAGLGAFATLAIAGGSEFYPKVVSVAAVALGSVATVFLLAVGIAARGYAVSQKWPRLAWLDSKILVIFAAIVCVSCVAYCSYEQPVPFLGGSFAIVWGGLGYLVFHNVSSRVSSEFRLTFVFWCGIALCCFVAWIWAALLHAGSWVYGAMLVLQTLYVFACSAHAFASFAVALGGAWAVLLWVKRRARADEAEWIRFLAAAKTTGLSTSMVLLAIVLLALPVFSASYALCRELLPHTAADPGWLGSLRVYASQTHVLFEDGAPSLAHLVDGMVGAAGTALLVPVLMLLGGLLVLCALYLVPPTFQMFSRSRGEEVFVSVGTWMNAGTDVLAWAACVPAIMLLLLFAGYLLEAWVWLGSPWALWVEAARSLVAILVFSVLWRHVVTLHQGKKRHLPLADYFQRTLRVLAFSSPLWTIVLAAYAFEGLHWWDLAHGAQVVQAIESLRGHGARAAGDVIVAMGVLLAGSATLLAFPKRLRDVLLPAWPALDVMGDVNVYLEQTTRKALFNRCDALLRHVVEGKFDKIVVVAHSQGTVLACDMLRRAAKDARSVTPETFPCTLPSDVTLITCGSPLGHLYHRFFPISFGWLESALTKPRCELGVSRWINFAATSDYVGMTIVKTTLACRLGLVAEPSVFEERWAGPAPFGHNEYFDAKSSRVSAAIVEAAGGTLAVAPGTA